MRRAALLALLIAGCGSSEPERAPVASATATSAPSDTIDVGAGACGFASAGGAVWVTALQENAVVRVDPSSHEAGVRVDMPGSPCWLAGDEDSVWVAPSEEAVIVELDARTGEERGRVEIGSGAADPKLVLDDGSLWATVTSDGTVVRVDDGKVTARIETGREPRSLLAADGLIWVANEGAGTVVAIDPERARIVRRLRVPGASMLVGYAGGSLWVGTGTDPELKRIDPRTGRTRATVAVGGNPGAGLLLNGELWVPNHLENTVSVVTVETDRVRTVEAGVYPSDLLEVDGDVWAASFGDGTIRVLAR